LRFVRPRSKQGRHEVRLANEELAASRAEMLPGFLWEGFVATLGPREREYWDRHVMGPPGTSPLTGISPQNFRKLNQRVFHKLHRFLNRE
jgi:hypothetical protein